jgi:hypothetical protein
LFWDQSAGTLQFRGGTAGTEIGVQIDTSGGIDFPDVETSELNRNRIKWTVPGGGGGLIARIGGYQDLAQGETLKIEALDLGGNARLQARAENDTGDVSYLEFITHNAGGSTSGIYFPYSDSAVYGTFEIGGTSASQSMLLFDYRSGTQKIAVFNEDSQDIDFRVESNANTNALRVDAGADRVGVLKAPTTYDFEVNGDTWVQGFVRINGPGSSGPMPFAVYDTLPSGISAAASPYTASWNYRGQLRSFNMSVYVGSENSGNDGSHYWNLRLRRVNSAGTVVTIRNFDTSAMSVSTWTKSVDEFTSSTWEVSDIEMLYIDCYKTGTPGNLSLAGPWVWFEPIPA